MRNFKIAQPQSIGQVTSFLSENRDRCFVMAGGTDLLDEIKNETVAPEVIIDFASIPDLSYIKREDDRVKIGALTRIADLADNSIIQEEYQGLHKAALSIASPQLRNVGTVGGNLCQRPRCWYYRDPQVICRKKGGSQCFALRGRNKYHAILGGGICHIVYPSDLAPAFISWGAEISISSSKKDKSLPLEDFYILPRVNVRKENVLEPDEVVKEIVIPLARRGEKSTYFKLKERGTWDFALVSAAVKGRIYQDVFEDIKIVLGGVAPIPWRLRKAEEYIKGKKVTESLVKQAAKEALKESSPLDENGYKKDLAEAVLCKAILSLVESSIPQ